MNPLETCILITTAFAALALVQTAKLAKQKHLTARAHMTITQTVKDTMERYAYLCEYHAQRYSEIIESLGDTPSGIPELRDIHLERARETRDLLACCTVDNDSLRTECPCGCDWPVSDALFCERCCSQFCEHCMDDNYICKYCGFDMDAEYAETEGAK